MNSIKSDSIENKIVNNEKHKGLRTFKPKLDVPISSASSGFLLLNKIINNIDNHYPTMMTVIYSG